MYEARLRSCDIKKKAHPDTEDKGKSALTVTNHRWKDTRYKHDTLNLVALNEHLKIIRTR